MSCWVARLFYSWRLTIYFLIKAWATESVSALKHDIRYATFHRYCQSIHLAVVIIVKGQPTARPTTQSSILRQFGSKDIVTAMLQRYWLDETVKPRNQIAVFNRNGNNSIIGMRVDARVISKRVRRRSRRRRRLGFRRHSELFHNCSKLHFGATVPINQLKT